MRTRALCLFMAIFGAVTLVSASGAATAKANHIARVNISTRAAVVRYLRSIHVNPRGVVIQRGARNYAGANCPGKEWVCTTTAHSVVQVAQAGGRNTFACSTASCSVVQFAPMAAGMNKAKCVKTAGPGPTATQSCSIVQSSASGDNVAVVFENVPKSPGLTHTASSTAAITQTANGASGNTACVTQNISLDGSTGPGQGPPVTVSLEAHQSVSITQDATGSGANSAQYAAKPDGKCDFGHPLAQNQTLTSTANSAHPVSQNENAGNIACPDDNLTPDYANLCLDIEQTGASGPNTATFVQTNSLTAVANSKNGPISQTQSSADGGLLGTINQDSSGVSTATATQTETQCEDAAKRGLKHCDTNDLDAGEAPSSLTQTQFGPVHKGVGAATQTGNGDDTFTVTQTSTQNNDTGTDQTNVVQGDCHTSGNCTVTQNTNENGTQNTNTQSGQDIDTTTNCTGNECASTGPSLSFLPTGLSVSNTDIGEFGTGGMRGNGTGSIDVSGITGPVFRAFLYWNGPTNSEDPDSNASVTFNGNPITGTNIGTASSNCWPFDNSQSYRADVTGLVTGDGSYSLSDFVKSGDGTTADVNGVSLIVFYDNGNSSDDRNVVLWNGNDSNIAFGADPAGWDETISGVEYPGSGSASLDTVVSDGQTADDPQLLLNGHELAPVGPIFQGDSVDPSVEGGNLWDVKSFDITSLLEPGSNDLHITTGTVPEGSQDCISLVVAAASVPASGQVIG